jgi:hypothetical protein
VAFSFMIDSRFAQQCFNPAAKSDTLDALAAL